MSHNVLVNENKYVRDKYTNISVIVSKLVITCLAYYCFDGLAHRKWKTVLGMLETTYTMIPNPLKVN